MQFHEKEIARILNACEYFASVVRTQDPSLGYEYDKTIRKIKSYAQETDCPDCWDPESTCQVH